MQLVGPTRSNPAAIVNQGNFNKILRHKEVFKKIVNTIDDLRIDIEKATLKAGEIIKNVQEWEATIKQRTEEADSVISDLTCRSCDEGSELQA